MKNKIVFKNIFKKINNHNRISRQTNSTYISMSIMDRREWKRMYCIKDQIHEIADINIHFN